jgi:hypothetical protein
LPVFVIARNISRDVQIKLAERRLAAYERLWALMRTASPYSPALDETARKELHGQLTDWYYAHGDGMLLPRITGEVYLQAKDNLRRCHHDVIPSVASQRLTGLDAEEANRQHGMLAQRQLSLLRTQLKSDLVIYGRPYGSPLNDEDRAFLAACGVDLNVKPWSEVISSPTVRPTQ